MKEIILGSATTIKELADVLNRLINELDMADSEWQGWEDGCIFVYPKRLRETFVIHAGCLEEME